MLNHNFRFILLKLMLQTLLLTGSMSFADDPSKTSLLSDSEKEEIRERSRAETLAREAKREQERLIKHRLETEQKILEVRRRTDVVRADQQRYSSQIRSIENEIRSLQNRQTQLGRELDATENRARNQEAEALKIKTQLEVTKTRLGETNLTLEQRRNETKDLIEANRSKIAKWNEEISATQGDIIKSDLVRLDFEKALAKLEVQTSELEKKLEDARNEKTLLQSEVESTKSRLEAAQSRFIALTQELKNSEFERENLRKEIRETNSKYLAEEKKLNERAQQLEVSKSLAEQEKVKMTIEQNKNEEALSRARQRNEENELALANAEAQSTQAKLAMMQARETLTKELTSDTIFASKDKKTIVIPKLDPPSDKAAAVSVAQEMPRKLAQSGRSWRLKKLCNLYANADTKSEKLNKLPSNTIVQAENETSGFVKATDTNGTEGYILSLCGSFE